MNNKTVNGVKCFLYLFGLLGLALSARGASFDCGKALTRVEKLICGDAELSRLDEELSTVYKTAIKDEKQADSIKQAQKLWMEERNNCADEACVKQTYDTRLLDLSLHATAHTPSITEVAAQQNSDNLRFRFCRDGDYNTCEQSGRGYTMCEHFLKLLNSLPRNEPRPVCDITLPPGYEEFQLAKWEPLPVSENMRLIYDMEMYLVGPSKSDYYQAKWPQYYPDGFSGCVVTLGVGVEACNLVPYSIWLADYQERMRKGEVEPHISRTRAALNERGQENLIRYERIPNGDVAQCRDNLAILHYATGSNGHVFILTGNSKLPIKAINGYPGSYMKGKFLLYQGHAVFVSTEDSSDGGFGWSLQLHVAGLPSPITQTDGGYVVDTRCDFRLNK